jgi:hypothetical protein
MGDNLERVRECPPRRIRRTSSDPQGRDCAKAGLGVRASAMPFQVQMVESTPPLAM